MKTELEYSVNKMFPKHHFKSVLTVTRVIAIAKENSTLGFSGLLLCWDRHLSSMLQKFLN